MTETRKKKPSFNEDQVEKYIELILADVHAKGRMEQIALKLVDAFEAKDVKQIKEVCEQIKFISLQKTRIVQFAERILETIGE